MHGGGFLFVVPLHVLVGDGPHRVESGDPHPHLVLDALHPGQGGAALVLVAVLQHEGRLPVAAVGDQRVVSGELLGYALGLENLLRPQHFLHLVLHGEKILEVQTGVRADVHLAVLLVGDDLGAEVVAHLGVLFEGVQFVTGQLLHGVGSHRIITQDLCCPSRETIGLSVNR